MRSIFILLGLSMVLSTCAYAAPSGAQIWKTPKQNKVWEIQPNEVMKQLLLKQPLHLNSNNNNNNVMAFGGQRDGDSEMWSGNKLKIGRDTVKASTIDDSAALDYFQNWLSRQKENDESGNSNAPVEEVLSKVFDELRKTFFGELKFPWPVMSQDNIDGFTSTGSRQINPKPVKYNRATVEAFMIEIPPGETKALLVPVVLSSFDEST